MLGIPSSHFFPSIASVIPINKAGLFGTYSRDANGRLFYFYYFQTKIYSMLYHQWELQLFNNFNCKIFITVVNLSILPRADTNELRTHNVIIVRWNRKFLKHRSCIAIESLFINFQRSRMFGQLTSNKNSLLPSRIEFSSPISVLISSLTYRFRSIINYVPNTTRIASLQYAVWAH